MSTELSLLAWTVVLGIVQLMTVAQLSTAKNGWSYGLSPRDTPPEPLTGVPGRLERAFKNLMETFPFAAAAILVAVAASRLNGFTFWGAQLYFWGRLVYVPVYAAGISGIRTLVWLVSLIGILLVLFGITRG